MRASVFWRILGMISVALLVILFMGQYLFEPVRSSLGFALACMALFVGINILAFYLGRRAAHSEKKFLFVQLVIGFIFFKMLLSIVLVILYWKTIQPQNETFILIFVLVYLVYTIFEIYTLEKLAKLKPIQRENESYDE